MLKKKPAKHPVYHVYKDNALAQSLSMEFAFLSFLKEQASVHRRAQFRVEKAVTIFDLATSPEDQTILDGLRSINRLNAIHASIYPDDRTGMDVE